MKKSLKSKIILAGLTIGVVAATVAASTYSWFLERTPAAEDQGATASVTAAQFSLGEEGEGEEITIRNIELVDDGNNANGYAPSDLNSEGFPIDLSYNPNSDLIYPGEGRELYIDDLGDALNLVTNRTVVLELDLTLGEDIASATDISIEADDIYYETSIADENSGWTKINGKYYRVVEDTQEVTANIGDLRVGFGIIGVYDDGEQGDAYMDETISVGIGDMTSSIKATAVQATPAAVEDVFGIEIEIDANGVVTFAE